MSTNYALINTETQDVLRTSINEHVLMSVANQMNSMCGEQRYTVLGINRDKMSASLFARARDCHYQDTERRKYATLGNQRLSAMVVP